MKNLYLFLFLIFISTHIRAQEIYFSSGKNITNFDYKSSNGTHENLNFRSGTGNYFEVGYIHGLINYKLLYSIGFTYNEYNSKASNYSTNYSWKTKYIGITNKISFNLSKEYSECSHYGSGLRTFVSIGFNTSTLTSGEQYVNNYYYDLDGNEDFLGIIVQILFRQHYQNFIISHHLLHSNISTINMRNIEPGQLTMLHATITATRAYVCCRH